MKKFINQHPKLYWVLVVLIAGLVFGIVTGIGCAKLEKAEAAVTIYHPEQWSGSLATDNLRQQCLNNYNYLTVFKWNGGSLVSYYFTNEVGFSGGKITNVGGTRVTLSGTEVCAVGSMNNEQNVSYILGANYPIEQYYDGAIPTYELLEWPLYTPPMNEPVYLANAPYLEYQSVDVLSNYVNEKIYDIDEGYHIVNYKIAGEPMTPQDDYKVLYEYRVYLPTKDYFRQFFREDMLPTLESLESMKSNIPKWRRNSVGSSDSKLWIFNLDRNIEAEKTNGDDVRIRLDYADIQTEIEEFNSVSLKEYYGFDDDAWGAYGKYIMAHLVVYRVDCIVYTYNTPDIYYGRNITVHFPPYLDKPIVTEYNGDYFNPDYDYDAELDAKIEQALKDAKEESDALLEEYKGMISNQENMFGSFDSEFADVGLWGALRGIGSGFLGLTGFITNFAVLIGGIFSFVPIAFQQYVGYTLLAILLIGLWKTIKG